MSAPETHRHGSIVPAIKSQLNQDLSKELSEIDSAITGMIVDYQNYRTTLLSTFAVSFAIPLSPITAHASHLVAHKRLTVAVFSLWAIGVMLMVRAFMVLMEKINVRGQLNLALSQFDVHFARILEDEKEMKASRDRAMVLIRTYRSDLEDRLKRLSWARRIVGLALSLFMVCVAIEFFTFLVCGSFGWF